MLQVSDVGRRQAGRPTWLGDSGTADRWHLVGDKQLTNQKRIAGSAVYPRAPEKAKERLSAPKRFTFPLRKSASCSAVVSLFSQEPSHRGAVMERSK